MGSMHTGLEEVVAGSNAWRLISQNALPAGVGLSLLGVAPNREGWVKPFAANLHQEKPATLNSRNAVHRRR